MQLHGRGRTPLATRKFGEVIEFLRKANNITEPPKVLPKSSMNSFLESLADNSSNSLIADEAICIGLGILLQPLLIGH